MRISEYIRNNEKLAALDFATVYLTIVTLLDDGYLAHRVD